MAKCLFPDKKSQTSGIIFVFVTREDFFFCKCRALDTTGWGVVFSPGVKLEFNVASWPLLSAVNQPSFGISRERVNSEWSLF